MCVEKKQRSASRLVLSPLLVASLVVPVLGSNSLRFDWLN